MAAYDAASAGFIWEAWTRTTRTSRRTRTARSTSTSAPRLRRAGRGAGSTQRPADSGSRFAASTVPRRPPGTVAGF